MQLGAGSFDGVFDADYFVAGEIVESDDVTLTQGRYQALLDVGTEALATHRAVETYRERCLRRCPKRQRRSSFSNVPTVQNRGGSKQVLPGPLSPTAGTRS
jgi:hypothetical protein